MELPIDADLIIDGGTVVTMDKQRQMIKDGALAVRGSRILAVGKREDVNRRYRARRTIDARNDLITPGFIDGHNHPIHYMSKGTIDDLPFTYRYPKICIPYERALTDSEVYLNAAASFAEMMLNGTTCFNDPGSLHGDAVGRAAEALGIRGIIAHDTGDLPFGSTSFRELNNNWKSEVEKAERLVDVWNGAAKGRIRAWFSIIGPDRASDSLCRAVKEKSDRYAVPIHAHLHVEPADFGREGFHSPIHRYRDLDLLDGNLYLAHLGCIVPDDIKLLVSKKVRGVHCPSRSMFGGAGYIAHGTIPEMVEAGMLLALGTDAAAISRFLDMVRLMYIAACGHKDARTDSLVMGAYKVFEMATIEGAAAIGWDNEIGSLEASKKADVTILDMSAPELHPNPLMNPIRNLVYAGTGSSTKTVIVDGNVVMENRTLKTVDLPALLKEVNRATTLLLNRTGISVSHRWPVF